MSESETLTALAESLQMNGGRTVVKLIVEHLDDEIRAHRLRAIDCNNLDETRGRVRSLESFRDDLKRLIEKPKERT